MFFPTEKLYMTLTGLQEHIRRGVPRYITGKFATIRKSDAGVEVREARDPQCGGNMLHLNQKGDEVYLRIREKDGKIVKMDMCMF